MSTSELIVYENKMKANLDIRKCDILVFTSPKNFDAYIVSHHITDEKLIAIGQTTSKYIEDITNLNVPYCVNPSEQSLYALLVEQLKLLDWIYIYEGLKAP